MHSQYPVHRPRRRVSYFLATRCTYRALRTYYHTAPTAMASNARTLQHAAFDWYRGCQTRQLCYIRGCRAALIGLNLEICGATVLARAGCQQSGVRKPAGTVF